MASNLKFFGGRYLIRIISSLGSSVTSMCLDANEILRTLNVFLNFKIDLFQINQKIGQKNNFLNFKIDLLSDQLKNERVCNYLCNK